MVTERWPPVGYDEHRRTLDRGEEDSPDSQPEGGAPLFTTLVGNATLEPDEGPDQTPYRLWHTHPVMPLLAWRPVLRPDSSPNDAR